MKVHLSFSLPEESEDHEAAINGMKYKLALDEVWEKVFRPAYKHGYNNQELNRLAQSKNGQRLIELLGEIYIEVKNDIQ